jgi:hypothetical protein
MKKGLYLTHIHMLGGGTFDGDGAEVFGTTLVGTKSMGFRATLKRLADC